MSYLCDIYDRVFVLTDLGLAFISPKVFVCGA